jgi:hypothetical protein
MFKVDGALINIIAMREKQNAPRRIAMSAKE